MEKVSYIKMEAEIAEVQVEKGYCASEVEYFIGQSDITTHIS